MFRERAATLEKIGFLVFEKRHAETPYLYVLNRLFRFWH